MIIEKPLSTADARNHGDAIPVCAGPYHMNEKRMWRLGRNTETRGFACGLVNKFLCQANKTEKGIV